MVMLGHGDKPTPCGLRCQYSQPMGGRPDTPRTIVSRAWAVYMQWIAKYHNKKTDPYNFCLRYKQMIVMIRPIGRY